MTLEDPAGEEAAAPLLREGDANPTGRPSIRVEPVVVHRDARGWVFEPIGPHEFADKRNAHLVLSQPGAIRGNHYHVRGTEIMVVVGPALVRYREPDGSLVDLPVAEAQMVRLTIPPGIPHAVQNTGTVPQLAIAFNTEPHDPSAPDVVPHVLI